MPTTSQHPRIVILGGTSGIGLATAQFVAAQGARVVIVGRRQVDRALTQLPDDAEGHAVDMRDENAIRDLFSTLGSFDHLAYTAGEPLTLGTVGDMDLDGARGALEIRLWGAYAAVKHGHPHIRPGGSITLSSGSASARPHPTWSIAAAVCGAVEALTRALAVELAPIRVNAIAPGVVRTDLWRDLSESERAELYVGVGAGLPVGRVGEPEEIAQAFAYLMHNGYSTGTILPINGGGLLV
jgi:NAD(P)-dependent dehydrogenase (short-subunit alcohol dehydrogenase family)